MQQKITLGRFGTVYGIRGWLKVISYTEPTEKILDFPIWQIHHEGRWETVHVEEGKLHSGKVVVKLAECDDRELARRYTNDTIAVLPHELPPLPKEEYYWADLVGLQVVTTEGINLGVIEQMMATGSNDVMVVIGEHRRLIPYLKKVIRSIDLPNKIMIIEWDASF
jgi:16S rRNA processing protein RimM